LDDRGRDARRQWVTHGPKYSSGSIWTTQNQKSPERQIEKTEKRKRKTGRPVRFLEVAADD
jgi:hypothetical protein